MRAAGTIGRLAWVGTAVFALSALAAVVGPRPARVVALVVSFVLFTAGCIAFVWAYAIAVRRSRTDVIGVAQLYLLTGDAVPAATKRVLLGALAVQVAVALGTAVARPYTSLAAGTLVPVFGVGLCGLWAARFGRFDRRQPAGDGTAPPSR